MIYLTSISFNDDMNSSWLHEEEFDEIQSNFDMTEIEENSNTSFTYHDLESFLITITVSIFLSIDE